MTPRNIRTLAIALAVSVGLNLFLGGMIASAWLAKRQYQARGGEIATLARPFDLRRGFEAVGPQARALAREIRTRHAAPLREAGQEMREARGEIRELLTAEPLDAAALRDALSRMRAASGAAQAQMHAALLEVLQGLSPEDRQRFLRAALQGRAGGGERRRVRPGG